MITLSLCMIVKNEEEVLGRCLASVADIADEIILVDTGSVDQTKEIAKQYQAKIFDFPWCDDFSAARNFSFSKATCAYSMWLDADDVLLPEDRERLKQLKKTLSEDVDMVMLPYAAAVDAQGKPTFVYDRERIVKTGKFRWEGEVHEAIVPSGHVIYADVTVTHRKIKPADGDRNLRIFEKKIALGKPLSAREKYYYARELYYHGRFRDAADMLIIFLQSGEGWRENEIDAFRVLYRCYQSMGKEEQGVYALFATFSKDLPRAEVCCELGQYFFNKGDYKKAIYWYETARKCDEPVHSGAFIEHEAYGYLPCIWLCVCYDRLGDYQTAKKYHVMAAEYHPDAPEVKNNQEYFNRLQTSEEKEQII